MTDGGLRPLGLGELLDAAIKIYRARWRDLIKVTAVVTLPAVVVETLIRMSTGSGGLSGTNGSVFTSSTRAGSTNIQLHQVAVQLGGTLALTVVSIFATALAVGGALRCVAGVYLGEEVGWRESLRFALGRLGSIVLVSLLVLLCELVGLLFCIIGYAVPWTFLFASIPALLVEGLKGRAALRRSRDLVRGRGWHVFATLGVGYLIGAAITGALAGLLVAVLFASHGNVVVFDLVTGVVTLITTVLVTPFTAALTMAVYFDLRVRKEGFDLWLLAQKVGGGAPEGGFPAQPGAPQWQPVPGWGAAPRHLGRAATRLGPARCRWATARHVGTPWRASVGRRAATSAAAAASGLGAGAGNDAGSRHRAEAAERRGLAALLGAGRARERATSRPGG